MSVQSLALVLLHRQGAEAALAGEQEQAATYVPDREVSVGIYRVPTWEAQKAVLSVLAPHMVELDLLATGVQWAQLAVEPWAQCAVVSQ